MASLSLLLITNEKGEYYNLNSLSHNVIVGSESVVTISDGLTFTVQRQFQSSRHDMMDTLDS